MSSYTFDLRKIFRLAIDLGKVIWGEGGDLRDKVDGIEATRLISALNPRTAEFPLNLAWVAGIEQIWAGPKTPPKPGWLQELEASTDLPNEDARQALQTIGLGVGCLRGTRQAEGKEWVEAGARHLWVGMSKDERKSSKSEYARAVRLWQWPGRIAAFDGPRPDLAALGYTCISPDWRVGMAKEERTALERAQSIPEDQRCHQLAVLAEARRTLPLLASTGTPAELATVYEAVADSLMLCFELKCRVAVMIVDTPDDLAEIRNSLLNALAGYDSLERALLRGGDESGFRVAIRIIRTFENILHHSKSVFTDVYLVDFFRPGPILDKMRVELARADAGWVERAENHEPLLVNAVGAIKGEEETAPEGPGCPYRMEGGLLVLGSGPATDSNSVELSPGERDCVACLIQAFQKSGKGVLARNAPHPTFFRKYIGRVKKGLEEKNLPNHIYHPGGSAKGKGAEYRIVADPVP